MSEQKFIAGYHGKYAITDEGRVLSYRRKDVKELKQYCTTTCYVVLHNNGRRQRCAVGRMVAEAFVGKPPYPNARIRYLDGNKLNNHKDNVRWLDRRKPGRKPTLTAVQVEEIRRKRKEQGIKVSVLAAEYHISESMVSRISNNQRRIK